MDLLFFIMPMAFFFTKDLFVLLWWIMCQILDQYQQTNEKIVVFSRDIAALKLIKRDFSTSSLFFGMKKGISIFSKMFSLVVTLFQKYRKSTKYIHNLGIAPPLFEVGFSGRNLSLIFFLHPTVVSVYMKNASLALKILSKALTYSLAILKLWYEKKGQGNSLDSYSLYKSRRQV